MVKTKKNLSKALRIFFAVLDGKEFVPKSPIADDYLAEIPHPDAPGGCTREELYYGTSEFGTGASVPVRPEDQTWHCTKCQEKIIVNIYDDPNRTDMILANINCPQGHIDKSVNAYGVNETLSNLRAEKKIY